MSVIDFPAVNFEIADLAFPIRLEQDGVNRFTVVYGRQVKRDLSYAQAATELGECIMHALACDSRLDNRDADDE